MPSAHDTSHIQGILHSNGRFLSHLPSTLEHMFESGDSVDSWERVLLAGEAAVARLRALQLEALHRLDAAQVASVDGCRSMQEWVAGRLDVSPETARDLVRVSRQLQDCPDTEEELADGVITFDRAVAEANLHASDASEDQLADSRGFDISGVRRMAAQRRRITPQDEQLVFENRFIALQPSLDESAWKMWGQLPGVDGRIVDKALAQRGDEFPASSGGEKLSQGQRQADALTSICQDSLTGDEAGEDRVEHVVTVFVDANLAADSGGEAGVTLGAGHRIGPRALAELLCSGRVELNASGPRQTARSGEIVAGGAAPAAPLCAVAGRWVRRRWLRKPLPAAIPPQNTVLPGWRHRSRQPHHPVLVPPSRGRSWHGLCHRSGQPTSPTPIPETQPQPTLSESFTWIRTTSHGTQASQRLPTSAKLCRPLSLR